MKALLTPVLVFMLLAVVPASAGLVTFDLYSLGDAATLDVTNGGVTVRLRGFNPASGATLSSTAAGLGVIGNGAGAIQPVDERVAFSIINPGIYDSFQLVSIQIGRTTSANTTSILDGSEIARVAFPASGNPSIDITPGMLAGTVWTAGTPISLVYPHTNAQMSVRAAGSGDGFRLYGVTFNADVPEPGTYALVGLGLAGLAVIRRRRNA